MTTTDLAIVDRSTLARHDEDDKPVVITNEQVALIKATIAAEATDAELELFFYDCRRRGVHPLDKLIHFTKRSGKYTPVTSIDFFRSRAARSREHMGTDDATYEGEPGTVSFTATVTVYRMVQGEKCKFTATARFAEYMPGPPNDFMWKKMPFGQLSKCAEALALRKGFPQELEGLHTIDEMENTPVDPPAPRKTVQRQSERQTDRASAAASVEASLLTEPRRVKEVKPFGSNNFALTLENDPYEYTTKDSKIALELEKFKGTDHTIRVAYKDNVWKPGTKDEKVYHNIDSFAVVDSPAPAAAPPQAKAADKPITSADIPFGR